MKLQTKAERTGRNNNGDQWKEAGNDAFVELRRLFTCREALLWMAIRNLEYVPQYPVNQFPTVARAGIRPRSRWIPTHSPCFEHKLGITPGIGDSLMSVG